MRIWILKREFCCYSGDCAGSHGALLLRDLSFQQRREGSPVPPCPPISYASTGAATFALHQHLHEQETKKPSRKMNKANLEKAGNIN